jgi:hypothetical protein
MNARAKLVEDFPITGTGDNPAWEKSDWYSLSTIGNGKLNYSTKFKLLWSEFGMYFLFDCDDHELTCTKCSDFEELYLEDVVEVFLWPDEKQTMYFEYEISPLGYELPLIVPNFNGKFHGWLPFLYDTDRKVIAQTIVYGGSKRPMEKAIRWRAEFYVPFKLLIGMTNCPPRKGSEWRANFCRLDYGNNQKTQWSWITDNMEDNFHNFTNFGKIIFAED